MGAQNTHVWGATKRNQHWDVGSVVPTAQCAEKQQGCEKYWGSDIGSSVEEQRLTPYPSLLPEMVGPRILPGLTRGKLLIQDVCSGS